MKKLILSLTAVLAVGVAWGVSPSTAQQACPPGQSGNLPYCQTLPPGCAKFTAKLSIARTTITRSDRRISVLAPITGLASGLTNFELHAAGLRVRFRSSVDSANRRLRFTRIIARSQANLGTGILTINYPGDADTRPQVVRLRSARNPARLSATRPTISATGRLLADGTVTSRARGVVRIQVEYVDRTTGQTTTLEFNAPIRNGRYSLNVQLSAEILGQIIRRCGSLHSYTLFTGYLPQRIRGEMKSYQVLPPV